MLTKLTDNLFKNIKLSLFIMTTNNNKIIKPNLEVSIEASKA